MTVCEGCGTENPPGTAYCSKCARKLDVETQQRVVVQRAAHTATGINWMSIIVTALVIIIILVVVGLFVTGVI